MQGNQNRFAPSYTDAIESASLANDPNLPRGPFNKAFSFEAWLSLLADEQPHLSEAENAANMAIFAKLLKRGILKVQKQSGGSQPEFRR